MIAALPKLAKSMFCFSAHDRLAENATMLKTQPESQIGEGLYHSATAHSSARPVKVTTNTFELSVEKVNDYSSNYNEYRVRNKQVSGIPSYPSMGGALMVLQSLEAEPEQREEAAHGLRVRDESKSSWS